MNRSLLHQVSLVAQAERNLDKINASLHNWKGKTQGVVVHVRRRVRRRNNFLGGRSGGSDGNGFGGDDVLNQVGVPLVKCAGLLNTTAKSSGADGRGAVPLGNYVRRKRHFVVRLYDGIVVVAVANKMSVEKSAGHCWLSES